MRLENRRKNMLVFCAVIFASVQFSDAQGYTFDLLREACPYSNFCTKTSLLTLNKTDGSKSCCYDCFCDELCALFGDCCPDAEPHPSKPNTAVLDCKPSYFAIERTKVALPSEYSFVKRESNYRMIDFCPVNYTEKSNSEVIEKCNGSFSGSPIPDDVVMMSDRAGRIFKNRHCAFCHGVHEHDVKSWSLKIVDCVDPAGDVQLTLSESTFFFMNYCIMTSERPKEIPATARAIPCAREITCTREDHIQKDGCLNGPYMPYLYNKGNVEIHKNVFCYKLCSGLQGERICPDYDNVLTRFSTRSYQMLLNLRPEKPVPASKKTGCIEAEIMDRYTGHCRRVFCPPFEAISYGRCVPLSQGFTNLYVEVNVMYTFKETSTNRTFGQLSKYNKTMENYYLQNIYSKYEYPKCKIFQLFLVLKTERSSQKFVQLVLKITYKINQECSMRTIGKIIRAKRGEAGDDMWYLQNQFFKMNGRFSFYRELFLEEMEKIASNTLLHFSPGVIQLKTVQQFFLCPYFKLSNEEYIGYVEKKEKLSKEYNLKDFFPWSRYLAGFYPVTMTQVAVCVDTYQPTGGKDAVVASVVFLIIAAVIALLEIRF